jgi:hypothetical protein
MIDRFRQDLFAPRLDWPPKLPYPPSASRTIRSCSRRCAVG